MNRVEMLLAVLAGAIVLAGVYRMMTVGGMAGGAGKGWKTMQIDELKKEIDAGADMVILDVRMPGELKSDHAPLSGAVNIPLQELPGRVSELPRDKKIVAVCKSGHRSGLAAGILVKAGFKDVSSLDGGMAAYRGKYR